MKGKCLCSGKALFITRVIVGLLFVMHGYGKITDLSGTTTKFEAMGIFLPSITGPLVAFVEFFGGIALILGAYTATVAAALAFIMLGAILFVHLKEGWQMPLIYLAALFPLMTMGGGKWALKECNCICGKEDMKKCCGGKCEGKKKSGK